MTNTASLFYDDNFLISSETRSDPAMALWVETLAPYEALLVRFMEHANPTCRGTFSQWRRDANQDGFSAKMLLHLTLWNSNRDWKCSDTEQLLSRQNKPQTPHTTHPNHKKHNKVLETIRKDDSGAKRGARTRRFRRHLDRHTRRRPAQIHDGPDTRCQEMVCGLRRAHG